MNPTMPRPIGTPNTAIPAVVNGVLSFADGHSETHKWTDARTMPPVNGSILAHWNVSQGNPDLSWIQARTTYKANDASF